MTLLFDVDIKLVVFTSIGNSTRFAPSHLYLTILILTRPFNQSGCCLASQIT